MEANDVTSIGSPHTPILVVGGGGVIPLPYLPLQGIPLVKHLPLLPVA
jgi:hypothetical protein